MELINKIVRIEIYFKFKPGSRFIHSRPKTTSPGRRNETDGAADDGDVVRFASVTNRNRQRKQLLLVTQLPKIYTFIVDH